MAISGIYKITSPSGKIYIGQSNNVKRRIVEHKSRSKKNNTKLYASLRKYGLNNHNVEILLVTNCSSAKNIVEEVLIKKYNCVNSGLNHLSEPTPNKGFKGKKHTKENRLKASILRKGKAPKKAIESRQKKVFCSSKNKKYRSISECARDLNISQAYASNMVNGKGKNLYGITFI